MKLRRSLYARPVIVRGEQCAKARLGRRVAEQLPDSARDSLALAGGTPLSCHGCQAPQALSTGTRLVPGARPMGVVAQELRMPAVPSSPCPRRRPASGVQGPVQASSVHACPSTRPLSSVRCGHLSVQVSGVQCGRPVIHPFPRPLCPTREVVEGGGAAGSRMAGIAGVGVVACRVHDRLVVCPSRNLAIEAGAGRASQRRRRLGPGRRSGRRLSSG
jgi:hypothetical protein